MTTKSSLIEAKHKWHIETRNMFYRWMDEEPEDFSELSRRLYTYDNKQWAPRGLNIIDPKTNCPQLCMYCYNIAWKNRMGIEIPIDDIEDLDRPIFNICEKRVEKNWKYKREMLIFASTHDIFPEMVGDYVEVLRKVVEAGREILIVTKANFYCIEYICKQVADLKDKIMFVITITTNEKDKMDYWERHAPDYKERLKCLKYVYKKGFKTSVSMEPYLSDPRPIIEEISPFVTHCIWLGIMKHSNELDFDEEKYAEITPLYTNDYVDELFWDLRKNDKVFYKFSMMRVLGLKGKKH